MTHLTTFVGIAALSCLVACTTPDISAELEATSTAFDAMKAATRPALEAQSEVEVAAETDRMIEAKELVFRTSGVCLPAGILESADFASPLTPCAFTSDVDVISGPINASQVIALETGLEAYLLSLSELADASSVAEVEAATDSFIDAFASLTLVKPFLSLAPLAQKITSEGERVSSGSSLLVKQLRHLALSKAVRQADSEISEAAAKIYSFYERRNPALSDAALALSSAEQTMTKARLKGSVAEYRASIQAFKEAFEVYTDLSKRDPSTWYQTFASAHSELNVQLQSGGGLDDLIAAINDLTALKPQT